MQGDKMSNFKKAKYKGFEIHYTNSIYKYDIYNQGLWYTSRNTLKQVKEYINNVIWSKENITE